MKDVKTEIWNGHEIRFVEKEPGVWWAVAVDVARALEYANPSMAVINHCEGISKLGIPSRNQHGAEVVQDTNIIPETGIYELVFHAAKQSRSKRIKAIAQDFKRWVFDVLKQLRQASGLEGFQVFRLLDKEHQKNAMDRLNAGVYNPKPKDFIKANTIADKAVSTLYGHAKMLKKDQMPPDMLKRRQSILDDTVNLISANESFELGLSVSKAVYGKYCHS